MATITETLAGLPIPAAYSHFKTRQEPPFVVYIGAGQTQFDGDDTLYWRRNTYQIEYYFTEKNEANETALEDALLAGGFKFTKSGDTFIEDMGVFVIFYDVN